MTAAEKITREELDRLHTIVNSTGSSDERNLKGFVLSTDVRTFKDIPVNIDKEIVVIQENIRRLILQVATDIELTGDSGKITYTPGGELSYELPAHAIEKYKKIIEAKQQNNVSIRSVQLAIQLLSSLNKQLMMDAEQESDIPLKRKMYITQAAYVYEMADIVLELLDTITLEGKDILQQIKAETEARLNKRLAEFEKELKKIKEAKEAGKISDTTAVSYEKHYDLLKEANRENLKVWEEVMEKVFKQDAWLNNMKEQSVAIELKRNAAKHQLDTLRDIAVVGEIKSLVGSMDDLVATIEDLELLELDEQTVLTLLFGNPELKDMEQKPQSVPLTVTP